MSTVYLQSATNTAIVFILGLYLCTLCHMFCKYAGLTLTVLVTTIEALRHFETG